MAYMLPVPTFQVRHPILSFILMKTDNLALHDGLVCSDKNNTPHPAWYEGISTTPRDSSGGSVWESNPPSRGLATITGFEVQAAHQHRYASTLFFEGLQRRMGSSSTPC